MYWKKRPPKEPGWWWVQWVSHFDGKEKAMGEPTAEEIEFNENGELEVLGHTLEHFRSLGIKLVYHGPIKQPKPCVCKEVNNAKER